ncbi:uncharacterized protein [Spinacia oleracea]|uniref:Uncharacterized protein isoform X1 n=1 Tax=Spinacia oleracea TaxID=3562 RepID=A0ABM3QIW0_SPIOL|nr:uncharacterized protein LOC130459772 isoform X1 [Spinacia oleracea]XP_056683295.1 uncharacterized protein LOC130459772 isoform X1 [Spinacia oleracea]
MQMAASTTMPPPSSLGKSVTDRKSKRTTLMQIQNETISAAKAVRANILPQKQKKRANGGSSLLEDLYKALDKVVKLSECEIYSYNADSDADPFLQRGAIWSFNFFSKVPPIWNLRPLSATHLQSSAMYGWQGGIRNEVQSITLTRWDRKVATASSWAQLYDG